MPERATRAPWSAAERSEKRGANSMDDSPNLPPGPPQPVKYRSPLEEIETRLEETIRRHFEWVCAESHGARVLKHDAEGLLALMLALESAKRMIRQELGFAEIDAKILAKAVAQEMSR